MKKKLEYYSETEWENICTNCGKCCLIKLQDEDSGDIYYTNDKIAWMPDSCAYRRLFENRPPVQKTTIKGRCISEKLVPEDELEDHIVDWDDL